MPVERTKGEKQLRTGNGTHGHPRFSKVDSVTDLVIDATVLQEIVRRVQIRMREDEQRWRQRKM